MSKKIGFLLVSIFMIFGSGVSFANPIAMDIPNICYKLNNVEIDNYKVIITENYVPKNKASDEKKPIDNTVQGFYIIPEEIEENISVPKIYVPKANECIKIDHDGELKDLYFGQVVRVLLIDKDVDIYDITEKLLDNDAIFVGNLWNSNCYIDSDCDEIKMYEMSNNDGNYELILTKIKNLEMIRAKVQKFLFYWGLAIILETLILFFIVKLFWKESQISNKKLFLFGIIPTTITLPFLWFVLPLLLGDGPLYIVIGEFLIMGLEAVMMKYGLNISRKKSIIVSVICNVFSFLILSWGSLVGDYYSRHSIIMGIPIRIVIYFPLLYFLIEFFVLCVTGKILGKDEISNKKLILTGIIAPIVMILSFWLLLGILDILDAWGRLRIVFFIVSAFIEMLLVRYLLKISWKKTIIMGIFSQLIPIAITFLVDILFGL